MALLVSHRQTGFAFPEPGEAPVRPGRGGKRPGAGRKRAPGKSRPDVAHVARPAHDPDVPVHVTMRATREVAVLRSQVVFARIERALARAQRQRDDFRILAFSVQEDHVHLVVEADGARALRAGLQGLAIRVARAVNAALRRRGRVWGDRYHRRDLTRPAHVRTAMVYVLQNGRKHGACEPGELDACSSARLFFGWNARGEEMRRRVQPGGLVCDPPVSLPRTWLGGRGWVLRGGGPIDPYEAARAAPPRSRAPRR